MAQWLKGDVFLNAADVLKQELEQFSVYPVQSVLWFLNFVNLLFSNMTCLLFFSVCLFIFLNQDFL